MFKVSRPFQDGKNSITKTRHKKVFTINRGTSLLWLKVRVFQFLYLMSKFLTLQLLLTVDSLRLSNNLRIFKVVWFNPMKRTFNFEAQRFCNFNT